MVTKTVPYAKLGIHDPEILGEMVQAFQRVLGSGHFILGPEVQGFEQEFAAFCGSKYALGVDNGTSALFLTMKALGIGPGDEVITAPNSFIASAAAIALIGAKPVFADIGADLNLDPSKVESVVSSKTKAILPVHLTGRSVNIDELQALATRRKIVIIEDAAQAVGAQYNGQRVGSFGVAAGFSLHPLKNLHAFGDAGVITTSDADLYNMLTKARNHGFRNRNESDFFSYNCRLDELQAALLRIQLRELPRWTEARRKKAAYYNAELKGIVSVPFEEPAEYCVYQTYMVQADRRDALYEQLLAQGVEAKIHYPIPIHRQKAAAHLGYTDNDLPHASRAATRILSLPLYPELTEGEQQYVIEKIKQFYEG